MDGWTRDDSKYCASIASRDKNLLTERLRQTKTAFIKKATSYVYAVSSRP